MLNAVKIVHIYSFCPSWLNTHDNLWMGRFSRAPPPCNYRLFPIWLIYFFKHSVWTFVLSLHAYKKCVVCYWFVCVLTLVPFWTWFLLFGISVLDWFCFCTLTPAWISQWICMCFGLSLHPLNSTCLSLFTAWIDSSYCGHCLSIVLLDFFPRSYFPVLSYIVGYASFLYLHIMDTKQNPFSLKLQIKTLQLLISLCCSQMDFDQLKCWRSHAGLLTGVTTESLKTHNILKLFQK